MNSITPAVRATPGPPRIWLIWVEWATLLIGILLCLPSEGYYSGLFLALFLLVISWIARWMRIHRLTRSTALDIPLLVFLFSLLISYFVVPDSATAFPRLTLFFTAISLFYTMINSPYRSLRLVLNLLIVLLAIVSLILIAQVDWSLEPVRFPLTKSIGIQLNRLIPNLGFGLPPWNVLRNILASLLGISLPFLLLQLYRAFDEVSRSSGSPRGRWSSWIMPGLLVLSTILILLDLILTESRTPWLVYSAILVLAVWWWLSRLLGGRIRVSHLSAFLGGLVLIALLLVVFSTFLTLDTRLISLLPGPDTLTGRIEIYPQSAYLAGDTPYTGGGLGAFTALYSFYIRVTPFNVFTSEDTGNNLYLYVLVEQGWLGLLSLIFLIAIPLFMGLVHIDRSEVADKGLVTAGITGVGFILLWGFFHAMLVASRAIPFLLLPAGLIFAGLGPTQGELSHGFKFIRLQLIRRRIAVVTIPLLLLLLAYLLLAPAPRSAWYANLGAIHMARVQLAGWPTQQWEDGSTLPGLSSAEALFQKSLTLNPHNRTANHRLGLIAMLRQDFSAAAHFLDTAYQANPRHRGVIKSLGYALVWEGEIERASELLRMIPEATQELESYIYWWNSFDRPDLSARALEARDQLLEAP
jgi:O-antigen ligase